MKILKFCPNCGKDTLKWNDERKWSCNICNFTLYHNVAGAVAVIIRCGKDILFTKRNQEPAKGKLDLAGGFTDPEESAEETCIRELFEELKLEVNPENLKYLGSLPNVYHYKDIDYNTIDLFFEYVMPEKFSIKPELHEISEAIWVQADTIDTEEIAFDSQRKFIEKYVKRPKI